MLYKWKHTGYHFKHTFYEPCLWEVRAYSLFQPDLEKKESGGEKKRFVFNSKKQPLRWHPFQRRYHQFTFFESLILFTWTHQHHKWQAFSIVFVVVRSRGQVQLLATPRAAAHQLPVPHDLTELAQTHVHWAGDASQPSRPLLPSSPALNLSQHQGLCRWVGSSSN